jgi:hypothetical protein
MRLAFLPALLCLPACIVIDDGGDDTQPEPGATRVVAAGSSFGECWGRCDADLAIDGDDLSLTFTSNNSEVPDLVNRGTLSAAAVDELAGIAAALADQDLLETYGCPDCDDGGAAHLDLVVGDLASRSTWEHGNPPPVLAGADAVLFDDLIEALTDCVATARVTPLACTSPF